MAVRTLSIDGISTALVTTHEAAGTNHKPLSCDSHLQWEKGSNIHRRRKWCNLKIKISKEIDYYDKANRSCVLCFSWALRNKKCSISKTENFKERKHTGISWYPTKNIITFTAFKQKSTVLQYPQIDTHLCQVKTPNPERVITHKLAFLLGLH